MAVAVILPKLDEAMRTGRIVKWLKKEGDRVEKGDALFVLETEKVTFEVEAEGPGILSRVMAQDGDEVAVGATVAFVLQPGEKAPEINGPAVMDRGGVAVELSRIPEKTETIVELSGVEGKTGDIKASPSARRVAREHNIDLSLVTGTGPGGRIVREDILRVVEGDKAPAYMPTPKEKEAEGEEIISLSAIRETIAQRMTESFTTPHFYVSVDVDTQELVKTRQQLIPIIESRTGIRLTITDLLIKMAARALEANSAVNCAYVDGTVKLFRRIDIGLITAVEGGLLVPVIHQANKKSLAEVARERAELVRKARDGQLSMKEMRGSTFTIYNMGMFEVDQFSAILQPPEAAILAVGRIIEKAVVRGGEIVIRPMMALTLSIDHRVLDAVTAANFLQSLKWYIENPVNMLI